MGGEDDAGVVMMMMMPADGENFIEVTKNVRQLIDLDFYSYVKSKIQKT